MRRIKKFINLVMAKGEWQIVHKSPAVNKLEWRFKTG